MECFKHIWSWSKSKYKWILLKIVPQSVFLRFFIVDFSKGSKLNQLILKHFRREIRKITISRLLANPISKCKHPKLEKKNISGNFQKFPKILNAHKIKIIYAIVLQFSGFTCHMDTNREILEKNKWGPLGQTLGDSIWNDPTYWIYKNRNI